VTTLYVVMGSKGQWSDYSEWMCVAYLDRTRAEEHARKAQAFSDAWYAVPNDERYERSGKHENGLAKDLPSPYDPAGLDAYGYTGEVSYAVSTVELLEEVPT